MQSEPQRRWWPTDGDEPDPRWSLANERTLLAHLRTSLAFVVAGLAVAGSHSVSDAPWWLAVLGLPLIVMGGVVGVSSRRRFLDAERAMRTGEPLPPPSLIVLLPWGLAALAIAALVLGAVQLVVTD